MRTLRKVAGLALALLVGTIIQGSAGEDYARSNPLSCPGTAGAPLVPLALDARGPQTRSQSLSDLIDEYTADYIGRSLDMRDDKRALAFAD
jgi:hypothetical protein